MAKIYIPWSEEQVSNLNAMQAAGFMHEYTCGGERCRRILVATDDGWICPSTGCNYKQDWAHAPMTEFELASARRAAEALRNPPPVDDGLIARMITSHTKTPDGDPVIHIMHYGKTLCGKSGLPKDWESDHYWTQEIKKTTCPECRKSYEARHAD